jgi:tryptophan 6-halogenase
MFGKRSCMNSVIILGGGSAGWMTASYLSVHNPELDITVIESDNIPKIGVGEATTPYLMKFFKDIGVENESDWMPQCNATYKNGVMYEDWDHINSRLWHAFEVDENKYETWNTLKGEQGLNIEDYWTSTMRTGHIAMRDSGKWLSDKDGNVEEYKDKKWFNGWPQLWAYHLDAGLFGDFLKKRNKTVKRVIADIEEVITNDDGISKIVATDGREFTADLYIDCTGFKRVLIDKVNTSFESFEPYLTHDKALVIRYPYADVENEMKPRTRAKALSSGWCWQIPLYDKISSGYVYTSDYLTDEEAEFEMRNDIGFDRTKGCESFVVDIKTGYYTEPWMKNVVPVGLSAGFIEPLESTLLFAIQVAGIRINQVLKGVTTQEEYNKNSTENMSDFLDYISISYYLSHRQDSKFWRDRKQRDFITERMKLWLKQAKKKLQPPSRHILFVDSSWISKLIGFNYLPNSNIKDAEAEKEIEGCRNFDYNSLISQKEYLDKFIYKDA